VALASQLLLQNEKMIVAIKKIIGFIGSRLVQKLLPNMQGFIVLLLVQYDMNTWVGL
jgi:hypothetical protein